MHPWLRTARTILATASVTSAAWLIGGAIWLQHERAEWAARPHVARPAPVSTPSVVVIRAGDLTMPVSGVRPNQLVDTFTQARESGARTHNALDILAPRGTPVLAAAAGLVEKLFLSKDGGQTIYVRSPSRDLIYYYAHLDSYAPGLAEGQQVRAGQVLGSVGSTGDADPAAPHLHFEIMRTIPQAHWYDKAEDINPYPLLTGRRPQAGEPAPPSPTPPSG
jgi:murein DD-endopeptidase MepM/ murein hydrolase activator NlpD